MQDAWDQVSALGLWEAQKSNALTLALVGLVAVLGAGLLFSILKSKILWGFATPFLILGLFELSFGGYAYFQGGDKVEQIETLMEEGNQEKLEAELPRMEKPEYWFAFGRAMILALGAFAALLIASSLMKWRPFILGLGLGVAVQALILLGVEIVARPG